MLFQDCHEKRNNPILTEKSTPRKPYKTTNSNHFSALERRKNDQNHLFCNANDSLQEEEYG